MLGLPGEDMDYQLPLFLRALAWNIGSVVSHGLAVIAVPEQA
jgi:hypothetical protein